MSMSPVTTPLRLKGKPIGTGQGPAELIKIGLGRLEQHVVGESQRQRHGALALMKLFGRQHHAHAAVEGNGARRVELHRNRTAFVESEIGLRCDRRGADAFLRQRDFCRLAHNRLQCERPLAVVRIEVDAGHQHGERHLAGRFKRVAEGDLLGGRLPSLEVNVDHLALAFIDDEGDVGGESSLFGFLFGRQPDPRPFRSPTAEGQFERPACRREGSGMTTSCQD